MLNKSQSISVRLSPEDYAYLMRIEQNGAITLSEKVRELIHMAQEQVGPESFSRAYLSSSECVAPYRALSKEHPDQRSDIVDALLDLVSETAAAVQTTNKNERFTADLEKRLMPVSEALITRLLPALLSSRGARLANAVDDQQSQRVERIRYLIEKLNNQNP
jgi:hypothetical protein